jgi:hypothetical protein
MPFNLNINLNNISPSVFAKLDHNIGFWEKRQFFRRKLAKIAENSDHITSTPVAHPTYVCRYALTTHRSIACFYEHLSDWHTPWWSFFSREFHSKFFSAQFFFRLGRIFFLPVDLFKKAETGGVQQKIWHQINCSSHMDDNQSDIESSFFSNQTVKVCQHDLVNKKPCPIGELT